MARRRKKTHHKRRRVGAIGGKGAIKEAVMMVAGATLGIMGGRLLNSTMVPATGTPTIPPTLIGAAEAGIGGIVAVKAKHGFIKGMGAGIAGNGMVFLLGAKGLGILPATIGYGPDPMHRPARNMLQGFRDVPKIGNFPKPNAIGANRDRRRMATQYAGVYG
jgi:hypothetical protein